MPPYDTEKMHDDILKRITIIERFIELIQVRTDKLEDHHQAYIQSVKAITDHFDSQLLLLTQTFQNVATTVTQLDEALRRESGTPSVLSRIRLLETWQFATQSRLTGHQEQREKIFYDTVKWVVIAILGGLAGMLGRQWHLW
jgi:hypothetical protein